MSVRAINIKKLFFQMLKIQRMPKSLKLALLKLKKKKEKKN